MSKSSKSNRRRLWAWKSDRVAQARAARARNTPVVVLRAAEEGTPIPHRCLRATCGIRFRAVARTASRCPRCSGPTEWAGCHEHHRAGIRLEMAERALAGAPRRTLAGDRLLVLGPLAGGGDGGAGGGEG